MHDVVVLAGGAGRRLGGVDKGAILIAGQTLLDRVLDACPDAVQRIVVGTERPTQQAVRWALESDPGSGPVPAAAAGLELVTADTVLLLAVDLPHFTAECASFLVRQAPAVLDADGRPQWLCGAWPTDRLRQALIAAAEERRLGAVLGSLEPQRLSWPGPGQPWRDCDTPEDLERLRS